MRGVIVDDERLARSELARLVDAAGGVELVGEARNAAEAAELIGRVRPDLVFLDIQMPGGDGFELLERLEVAPFGYLVRLSGGVEVEMSRRQARLFQAARRF